MADDENFEIYQKYEDNLIIDGDEK